MVYLQRLNISIKLEEMKIFNWMNRKFGSIDERSLKKGEFIAKETDKKPLIEKAGVVDVDVDWRANLLTIGTLGFDQLQKFIPDDDEYLDNMFHYQNEEEAVNDDNDDDDNDECHGEELLFEKNNEVHATNFYSLPPVITNLQCEVVIADWIKSVDAGNTLELIRRNENNVDSEFKKKKKKKVTLAELFNAETIEEMNGNNEKDMGKITILSKCTSGSGHSSKAKLSAKKLIPGVARVDARLVHKLNRVVTRMLKRKIHPDPVNQGKNQKDVHKNKSTCIFGQQLSVDKHSINETVSLLPTRDVEI